MNFTSGTRSAYRLFLAAIIVLSRPLPAAAGPDIPPYPAATTQPLPPGIHSVVSSCGRSFTMEKSMRADADPRAVAKWYSERLPGSRTIDLSRAVNDEAGLGANGMTSIEIFADGGSQVVVVNRMTFDRALATASKSIGADKTQIGIERVSPPFDPGSIALAAEAAAGGDPGRRAKQQMKAACKE